MRREQRKKSGIADDQAERFMMEISITNFHLVLDLCTTVFFKELFEFNDVPKVASRRTKYLKYLYLHIYLHYKFRSLTVTNNQ